MASFGLLGPCWKIEEDRVIVARPWWPIVLSPLLFAAVWIVQSAFDRHVDAQDGKLRILGAAFCALFGIVGLMSTPLRPPGRIVCTRNGILFGLRRLNAEDIEHVGITEVIERTRYGTRSAWKLEIMPGTFRPMSIVLVRGGSNPPPAALQVVAAMRALLASRAQAPAAPIGEQVTSP